MAYSELLECVHIWQQVDADARLIVLHADTELDCWRNTSRIQLWSEDPASLPYLLAAADAVVDFSGAGNGVRLVAQALASGTPVLPGEGQAAALVAKWVAILNRPPDLHDRQRLRLQAENELGPLSGYHTLYRIFRESGFAEQLSLGRWLKLQSPPAPEQGFLVPRGVGASAGEDVQRLHHRLRRLLHSRWYRLGRRLGLTKPHQWESDYRR